MSDEKMQVIVKVMQLAREVKRLSKHLAFRSSRCATTRLTALHACTIRASQIAEQITCLACTQLSHTSTPHKQTAPTGAYFTEKSPDFLSFATPRTALARPVSDDECQDAATNFIKQTFRGFVVSVETVARFHSLLVPLAVAVNK
jgi:hypothetical protein